MRVVDPESKNPSLSHLHLQHPPLTILHPPPTQSKRNHHSSNLHSFSVPATPSVPTLSENQQFPCLVEV